MTEILFIAILIVLFILFRAVQWILLKRTNQDQLLVGQQHSTPTDLDPMAHIGGETGATGIVPGGVSYYEQPEKFSAAIQLGNKRFGKGK